MNNERQRHDDPKNGPRILFFSGGTALRDLSRRIIRHTHNTAHVITPFDSGGSSAVLRRAFAMAAPGDLRNRLMALADRGHEGHPEIFELFAHRFPKEADRRGLDAELAEMASGAHPLVSAVPPSMRIVIRSHLGVFLQLMPPDFDLRGASIGNLILTAGYLQAGRSFTRALESFQSLVRVLGEVAPVCEDDLHLAARLKNGSVVCGQHRITGKETAPPAAPPVALWTCRGENDPEPAPCAAGDRALELVARADLICFPMGSFFTSVLANLLPSGTGRAVAANPCPKIFIPNLGDDPESRGIPIHAQARFIVDAIRADLPGRSAPPALDMVLADLRTEGYPLAPDPDALRSMGLTLLDRRLVTAKSAPLLDAELLARELMRLADGGR